MQIPAPVGLLDAVGGQPMLPAAVAAWSQAAERGWADPAAIHHAGRQSRLLLEAARASIATSLSALGAESVRPDEVWFFHTVEAARQAVLDATTGPVLVASVDALATLESLGERGQVVGVDPLGRLDLSAWAAGASTACLGVLQAANPEVGTTQPVAQAAQSVPLLMDAVQTVARLPLPGGWRAMTAQASDWGGPAGLAILVARRGFAGSRPASTSPWLDSTPDVPAAVSAAMALESVVSGDGWRGEADRAHRAIDSIRAAVAQLPDVELVGDPDDRLPHVMTFSALYVAGEALVAAFDRRALSVASGSACLNVDRPSHVLAAMGAFTGGNVRVSLPFGFDDGTVERFIDALPEVITQVRDEALR